MFYVVSVEEFVVGSGGVFDLIIYFELIEYLFDFYGFMVVMKKFMSDGGFYYFYIFNVFGMDNQVLGYNSFCVLVYGIFLLMYLQVFIL